MIGLRIVQHGVAHSAEKIGAIDIDKALFGHFLDVGTGGKGLFRPGDDDAAHLVIGIGCFEHGGKFRQHLGS